MIKTSRRHGVFRLPGSLNLSMDLFVDAFRGWREVISLRVSNEQRSSPVRYITRTSARRRFAAEDEP